MDVFRVVQTRGEERPIGGDSERPDRAVVREVFRRSPRRQVPHPDGSVVAAGDDRFAVGRECKGVDAA
jgi:hypothetical protein